MQCISSRKSDALATPTDYRVFPGTLLWVRSVLPYIHVLISNPMLMNIDSVVRPPLLRPEEASDGGHVSSNQTSTAVRVW